MGSFFVVLDYPPASSFSHVIKRGELMLVEQILAVSAVEPFDVIILVGFSRLDVLDSHAGLVDPVGKYLARELRVVISPERTR